LSFEVVARLLGIAGRRQLRGQVHNLQKKKWYKGVVGDDGSGVINSEQK